VRLLRGISALLFAAGALKAQVLEVRAGGSSLYNGYGLSTGVWGESYDGWLGVGYQEAWRVGGFARFRRARDTVKVGNDLLTLRLPTDIFGGAANLLVQGASWQHLTGPARATVFGGASATGLGVPLFAARRANRVFGALFIDDTIGSSWRVGGSTLLTDRPTTMATAEWRNRGSASAALSTGLEGGGGDKYNALSGVVTYDTWDARASIVASDSGFRRASLPIPAQTGLDGVNAELSLHPFDWGSLMIGRHQYVSDSGPGTPRARASGSSAVVTLLNDPLHLQGSGGVYVSRSPSGRNVSAYVATGWRPADGFGVDAYALQSRFNGGAPKTSPAVMLHERASQRLTLDQMITGFGRGMSVGLGGNYIGRFGEYSLTYQIVNDPFDARAPFKRTLAVTTQLQLGDYNANVASTVSPAGGVSYTASAERYLYLSGENGTRVSPLRIRMDRYVVEGIVRDESGEPVAGAAIALDGAVV
jgi:hypothetical protein